jgi:hypothetical protein
MSPLQFRILSGITLLFFPGLIGLVWCLVAGHYQAAWIWGTMMVAGFVAGVLGGSRLRRGAESDQECREVVRRLLKFMESKHGPSGLTEVEVASVAAWMQYIRTAGKSPDPTGLYFALYDTLPGPRFGSPANLPEYVRAARAEQGLPALTPQQSKQLEILSVAAYQSIAGKGAKK